MAEQQPENSVWDRLKAPLPTDRIEFRIQSISSNGWAILLAYKDARVDMDRLDAVLGPDNWERKHRREDNREYCSVGIREKAGDEFVWKEDVGVPSNSEAVKGEASDAFKRACFNVGIGRELYDMPLILVQLKENEFNVVDKGPKKIGQATYDLELDEWTWHIERSEPDENGRTVVEKMKAVDQHGELRFQYPRTGAPPQAKQQSTTTETQAHPQSGGGEKPWYNDFEQDKDYIQEQIDKGADPNSILKHLQGNFKVNKKTQDAIRAMKPSGP